MLLLSESCVFDSCLFCVFRVPLFYQCFWCPHIVFKYEWLIVWFYNLGHRRCVSLGRSPRRGISTNLNVSLLDDQPIGGGGGGSVNYNSLSSNASSSLNSNGTDNSALRFIPEDINPASIVMEGCLMRKKTAKRGHKMALPYGMHYWCVLTSPSLDGDYQDSGE